MLKERIRWVEDGDYIEARVSEDVYYCTNKEGAGLFCVNPAKNERRQLEGTCQFTVNGIKDKKGKLRKYLAKRFRY